MTARVRGEAAGTSAPALALVEAAGIEPASKVLRKERWRATSVPRLDSPPNPLPLRVPWSPLQSPTERYGGAQTGFIGLGGRDRGWTCSYPDERTRHIPFASETMTQGQGRAVHRRSSHGSHIPLFEVFETPAR